MPLIQIDMLLFDKEWIMPDGKYLVRTVGSGPLKTVHYLQARVNKVWDKDKKRWEMRVDVSRQSVTHISCDPLEV